VYSFLAWSQGRKVRTFPRDMFYYMKNIGELIKSRLFWNGKDPIWGKDRGPVEQKRSGGLMKQKEKKQKKSAD